MSVSCRRPGCTNVAAVTIHYDPVSCQLWLDPITVADRSSQVLCAEHAERLSPPRGWVVVDRRGAQTTIRSTTDPAAAPPPPVARRAVRRRWGSFEEPTLDFTAAGLVAADEPEPPAPDPDVVDPEPDTTSGPEPEAETDQSHEDMERLLKPTGGLLGQAFAATGDQRSVLTLLEESTE